MSKKTKMILVCAALLAAAAIGGIFFLSTHVSVAGLWLPKNAAVYDLTGKNLSAADYEAVCAQFPNAQVIWDVPFQGARLPVDTQSVTVTALTAEDIAALEQFPRLEAVQAEECSDLANLAALQEQRPDLQVIYQVPVGKILCSSQAETLEVTDGDAADLRAALPLLPKLRTLQLKGKLPAAKELLVLQEAFPGVAFAYDVKLFGNTFSTDTEVLDLADREVTAGELMESLPLFRNLKELRLPDDGMTDSELRALIRQLPDTFVRCQLEYGDARYSTDAAEITIADMPMSPEDVEEILTLFPKLEKLVLVNSGMADETLDGLNQKYPDVRIVWTMQIGQILVRTDDVYFFPAGFSESGLPDNEELKRLRYCTDMVAIDVGHSEATECDWAASMPHLQYLILADTLISDLSPLSDLKELVYLEIFMMENLHDYSPLLGCTALQDLNIGMTDGDPEPLSHMTWLHNLQWRRGDENPATRDRVLMLADQLPDTNVTIDCWRNIGGPWRYLPNYYVFRDIIGGVFFDQDHIQEFWGMADARAINACSITADRYGKAFAGDVLAEMVKSRMDAGEPIPGVKNVGSEKAEILYQHLLNAKP